MKCSICGCEKYTKGGNTTGGKWVYKCSNGHRWHFGSTNTPFPYRDDDYYHPKNYSWDIYCKYVRIDDPSSIFGDSKTRALQQEMTK